MEQNKSAPASTTAAEPKKKSFFAKGELAYGIGSFGMMPSRMITGYMVVFCTYVLGISAKWMAGLLLVTRIWDGINDPIIGSFPDRWKIGKSGERFKPYIKVFKYVYVLTSVLVFVNWRPLGMSAGFAMFWIAVMYVLYGMSSTMVHMPFNALLSVISDNPADRVKLSRGKLIGTLIASLGIALVVPLVCYDSDNNLIAANVLGAAIVMGVISIVSFIFMDRHCPEIKTDVVKDKGKYSYKKAFGQIFTNRPLMGMMVVALGLSFNTAAATVKPYFYAEYYGNAKAMSLGAISYPINFVLMMVTPILARKFGERTVCRVSYGTLLALRLLMFLPISNVYVFSILENISTIAIIPASVVSWSILSSAVDYGEWKNGSRGDGATYSLYSFIGKFGGAFGSAAVMLGVDLLGYVAGSNVTQSAAAINGIRWLYLGTPAFAMLIVVFGICGLYNLSDKKVEEIGHELKERRALQAAAARKED